MRHLIEERQKVVHLYGPTYRAASRMRRSLTDGDLRQRLQLDDAEFQQASKSLESLQAFVAKFFTLAIARFETGINELAPGSFTTDPDVFSSSHLDDMIRALKEFKAMLDRLGDELDNNGGDAEAVDAGYVRDGVRRAADSMDSSDWPMFGDPAGGEHDGWPMF